MQQRTKKIAIGLALFTGITMGLGKYFDSRCEKGCIGEAMADNAEAGIKGLEKWNIHINDDGIILNDKAIGNGGDRVSINISDDEIGSDENNPRRVKDPLKETFAGKDLKKIEIKSFITDWTIREGADDKVTFVFKGYLPEKEWAAKESAGYLEIELKKKGPLQGELLLPKDFKGEIVMANISGDIEVEKLAKAEVLNFTNVSGDVKILASPSRKLQVNSVSGEIVYTGAQAGKDLKIDFNTVSGDVDTTLKTTVNALGVRSVSGDFTLKASKNVGFHFDMEGVSASFNDLPKNSERVDGFAHRGAKGDFGPDPRGNLTFHSVSGDFQLETAE